MLRVGERRHGLFELVVEAETGEQGMALAYESLTGPVGPGDEVIMNSTAVDLGLGSGGKHFVLWNLATTRFETEADGHIMKLRYTPLQFSCLAVEEQASPHHGRMADAASLGGLPVVCCSVHSQLPAAALAFKNARPDGRLAYVMTDGGALPLAFSELAARLRSEGVIDLTVTSGHAFGGDLEAINLYSGLVAARVAGGAEAAVVCMGPGIGGSGTMLGFSGIEQGQAINAVAALGGRPIAVPRIAFADSRPRHAAVSSQTVAVLSIAALARSTVVLPAMEAERMARVEGRLREAGVYERHDVLVVEDEDTVSMLERWEPGLKTMGRRVSEEPEFFRAAGCAGLLAARILNEAHLTAAEAQDGGEADDE